jgi:hypothetical protein
MAEVVALPEAVPLGDPHATAQRRLVLMSRGLAVLFSALVGVCLLWVLGAFLFSFFLSDHVLVRADGVVLTFPVAPHPIAGAVRFSTQSFVTRAAGFADVLIATIPVGFVCLHLRALFRLYAQGIVFARENAVHIQRIGLWLVAWPVAKVAANMLFQLAGGADKAWAQFILLDSLILGLIVLAIAQVMAFGHEIEQDRAEIV